MQWHSINKHERVQITIIGGCNKHTDPSKAPKQVRTTASRHDPSANECQQRASTTVNVSKRKREQDHTRADESEHEPGLERVSEDRPVGDER